MRRITTEVLGLPLEVEFDYIPGRPGAMYPLDRAYPPEPAEVDIEGIYMEGLEVSEILAEWVLRVCKDAAYYSVENEDDAEEDPWYEEKMENERMALAR